MAQLLWKELQLFLYVWLVYKPKGFIRRIKSNLCVEWHTNEPSKLLRRCYLLDDGAACHLCSKCGAHKYKLPNGEWRKF